MKFTCTPELIEYMDEKKKHVIIVELVMCNNTEFEVAELHVYLIDEKRADYFKQKQGYGEVKTDFGAVLLPRFKMEYDEEVFFGVKKFLCFKSISYKGIVLKH